MSRPQQLGVNWERIDVYIEPTTLIYDTEITCV